MKTRSRRLPMIFVGCSALLLGLADCTQRQPSTEKSLYRAQSTVAPRRSYEASAFLVSRPLWVSVSLKNASAPVLEISGHFIVAHTDVATSALDATTGRRVWQHASDGQAIAQNANSAFLERAGHIERVLLTNGKVVWSTAEPCAKGERDPAGVDYLEVAGADLFAGCARSGRLSRMSVDTGTLRASNANAIGGTGFDEILPIGTDALAVRGANDVLLARHFALLRRSDLAPLIPVRRDTYVLGVVGTIGFFIDKCCYGRLDGPVTLVPYDLRKHRELSPIDLHPDPDRPKSIGDTVGIVGAKLYVSAGSLLDDYGDVRRPRASPRRLLDGLTDSAQFLENGIAFSKRSSQGELFNGLITPLEVSVGPHWWRATSRNEAFVSPRYNERAARDVYALADMSGTGSLPATEFVRARDGARVVSGDSCGEAASVGDLIVARCVRRVRKNAMEGQWAIEAFRFRKVPQP